MLAIKFKNVKTAEQTKHVGRSAVCDLWPERCAALPNLISSHFVLNVGSAVLEAWTCLSSAASHVT